MTFKVAVRVRRGSFALEAEFETGAGVTGVFGPSGHGKTTLLNAVAGLIPVESGEIRCGGETFYSSGRGIDVACNERGVGVVFQEPRLFPHMSVEENLRFGMRPGQGPVFGDVAGILKLGGLLKRNPQGLSGGEAMRVAIGRALLSAPRLLLMDEPFSGLDARARDLASVAVREALEAFKIPALLVSHRLSDILRMTRQIVVLEEGRVAGAGDAYEVMDQERVYRLLRREGIVNVLGARLVEASEGGAAVVELGGHRIQARAEPGVDGRDVLLEIAARDVVLSAGQVEGLSARNVFPSRILRLADAGGCVLCHLDAGGQEFVAEITAEAARALQLKEGGEAFCVLKTSAAVIRPR